MEVVIMEVGLYSDILAQLPLGKQFYSSEDPYTEKMGLTVRLVK